MNITNFTSPFSTAYVEHQEEIIGCLTLTVICCCSGILIKKIFQVFRRAAEESEGQDRTWPLRQVTVKPTDKTPLLPPSSRTQSQQKKA